MQMARGADPQTRPQVLEILDDAKALGLKVLRMWAFGEGPLQYNSLQRYPGAHTLSHLWASKEPQQGQGCCIMNVCE